jgi:dienelactone hydrolase
VNFRYCRGGGVAIRLLAEHAPLVECGIICHPGPLYQSLWPSIEAPTAWHLAEKDNWMTDEHLAVLVRLAAEKQAQGQTFEQTRHLGRQMLRVHPALLTDDLRIGTTHGFASRPNTGHDPSMVAFDNVKDDTVRFFKEHLGLQ